MDLTRVEPTFKIIANDADVTATIRDRLRSIRVTDEAGTTSDTVEITIADHDPLRPVKLPETGAELEVSLGYVGGTLRSMGRFVFDEAEVGGWPSYMTIRCRAAPQDKSSRGQKDLQTQKTRSWKAGTTIGAMVKKIAQEHGMQAAVAASLASIALPHTDQTNESDMNLLLRIARRYDAVAKPAAGRLVFAKRGEGESVGGEKLPRIQIAATAATDYRMTLARRDSPGTVIAYYRDTAKAKRRQVKVGDGDPVKTIRRQFRDKDSAVAGAKAEQSRRARSETSLSISFPGNPDVTAESVLVLGDGFHEAARGEWLVKTAEHYLGPQGYRTSIDAERPNSHPDVAKARDGNTTDEDQPNVDEGG